MQNTGARAGDEVELYLLPPAEGNGGLSPKLQLEGLQRVSLAPGETRTLAFVLDPRMRSEVDRSGVHPVQPGGYVLVVSGARPNDATAPAKRSVRTLRWRARRSCPVDSDRISD